MTKLICPFCGAQIQLDKDIIPHGYCDSCGEMVKYSDAANYKLSKQLLEHKAHLHSLPAETLFTIAQNVSESKKEELMMYAAVKGHTLANLYIGYKHYRSQSWSACKEHLELASKNGSNDAAALLLVVEHKKGTYFNESSLLSSLETYCSKNFEDKEIRHVCKEYINVVRDSINSKIPKIPKIPKESYTSTYSFPSEFYDTDRAPCNFNPSTALDTFYTDSRNGERVFYHEGLYYNESGRRVPIQHMDG